VSYLTINQQFGREATGSHSDQRLVMSENGQALSFLKELMLMMRVSYVGRVNYVVSLVSLTSLLDRRSEDLGEGSTGYEEEKIFG